MRTRITIATIGVFLLLVGLAGAQAPVQSLLPGTLIPKFVDPLPVAGDISVVNATSVSGNKYNIHIMEFKAQILPSTGVPASPGDPGADPPIPPTPAISPNTASWVWGYLTDADVAAQAAQPAPVRPSYLGPVVVAKRGLPAYPTYLHKLPYPAGNVQALLPVDMTLDWANPLGIDCTPINGVLPGTCISLPYSGPWPSAVHLHGGEVAPAYDGGPDAWRSPIGSGGPQGIAYPGDTYTYPNGQEEETIWFHPHEFGVTRLAVYAGLAGVYSIVDPGGPSAPVATATMPAFPQHDIPLIIQDRSFDTNGQLFYNLASNPQPNPTVHPFWIPEFIGDAIVVNGKTWPYLTVERRQYRFRLLNGSNARFYDLTLSNGSPFIAIATDDGYIANAVSTPNVIIGPGERYEVIVDFRSIPGGTEVIMKNAAGTPFPGGDLPIEGLTDTVMKFKVVGTEDALNSTNIVAGTPIRKSPLQPILEAHNPATGSITRQLTLNEVSSIDGPLELVLNNSKYNLKSYNPSAPARPIPVLPGCTTPLCRETELPAVGDTEIWEIINISADAHPMHTHLTGFQLLDRTPFINADAWIIQYEALKLANGVLDGGGPPNQYNVKNADGAIGGNPPIHTPGILDTANKTLPLPYERGWKDTVIAYPGEVTRIVVRWAPQDAPATGAGAPTAGTNLYPFDPRTLIGGVGYVWHCHILDHEDNEMMRTYTVGSARQPVVAAIVSPDINKDGCVDRTDYNLLMAAIRARSTNVALYDINMDGVVNIADARKLVLLFTNPGGAPCL